MGGRDDPGAGREEFADPRRRAGGLADLAPDLRYLAERTRAEHGEQHELRQRAAGHAVVDHALGAEPEHHDDAGKGEEQRRHRDEGAGLGHLARGLVGAVGGEPEPVRGKSLGDERLHHPDRAEALARKRGGVGERLLRGARALAHAAARRVERQDDHRNRQQDKGRKSWAGRDHHRGRADEQEEVAQRDRRGGAERRLQLRGVGGEARDDLAGLFLVEEARIEPRQMREQVAAQIGHDPLAERHHEIEPRPRREREHGDHPDHRDEIVMDEPDAPFREAVVDHAANREGDGERGGRSHEEGDQRERYPAAMAQRIGQEGLERAERSARLGRRGGGRFHFPRGSLIQKRRRFPSYVGHRGKNQAAACHPREKLVIPANAGIQNSSRERRRFAPGSPLSRG